MSRNSVRGSYNFRLRPHHLPASTHIRTVSYSGQRLTLATRIAQSTISPSTAALARTQVLQPARRADTAKPPRKSAPMPTLMVRTFDGLCLVLCRLTKSEAFDDQTSTFIIPAGAGFEVIFCPGGRSTNIIATSKARLTQLSQQGHVSRRDNASSNSSASSVSSSRPSVSSSSSASAARGFDVFGYWSDLQSYQQDRMQHDATGDVGAGTRSAATVVVVISLAASSLEPSLLTLVTLSLNLCLYLCL